MFHKHTYTIREGISTRPGPIYLITGTKLYRRSLKGESAITCCITFPGDKKEKNMSHKYDSW